MVELDEGDVQGAPEETHRGLRYVIPRVSSCLGTTLAMQFPILLLQFPPSICDSLKTSHAETISTHQKICQFLVVTKWLNIEVVSPYDSWCLHCLLSVSNFCQNGFVSKSTMGMKIFRLLGASAVAELKEQPGLSKRRHVCMEISFITSKGLKYQRVFCAIQN